MASVSNMHTDICFHSGIFRHFWVTRPPALYGLWLVGESPRHCILYHLFWAVNLHCGYVHFASNPNWFDHILYSLFVYVSVLKGWLWVLGRWMFTANHGLNNPEFAIFTVTQVGVEWLLSVLRICVEWLGMCIWWWIRVKWWSQYIYTMSILYSEWVCVWEHLYLLIYLIKIGIGTCDSNMLLLLLLLLRGRCGVRSRLFEFVCPT